MHKSQVYKVIDRLKKEIRLFFIDQINNTDNQQGVRFIRRCIERMRYFSLIHFRILMPLDVMKQRYRWSNSRSRACLFSDTK